MTSRRMRELREIDDHLETLVQHNLVLKHQIDKLIEFAQLQAFVTRRSVLNAVTEHQLSFAEFWKQKTDPKPETDEGEDSSED